MDRLVVAQLVHRYLVESGHTLAALALADGAPRVLQGDHAAGSLLHILDQHVEAQVRACCT